MDTNSRKEVICIYTLTYFINKMEEEAKKDKNGFNPEERIDKYRTLVNSLYADM